MNYHYSILIFCTFFTFAMDTTESSNTEKPANVIIPESILNEYAPPENLKQLVKELFSQEVCDLLQKEINRPKRNDRAVKEGLAQLGFNVFKYDGGLTCENPYLKEWVFKVSLHGCPWKHYTASWKRVVFAKKLKEIINKYKLNIAIPTKYIIPFEASREKCLIIAQKIDIGISRQLSKNEFVFLKTLIEKTGFHDISVENIVFTTQDKMAIIDTEPGTQGKGAVQHGLDNLKKAFPSEWTLYNQSN